MLSIQSLICSPQIYKYFLNRRNENLLQSHLTKIFHILLQHKSKNNNNNKKNKLQIERKKKYQTSELTNQFNFICNAIVINEFLKHKIRSIKQIAKYVYVLVIQSTLYKIYIFVYVELNPPQHKFRSVLHGFFVLICAIKIKFYSLALSIYSDAFHYLLVENIVEYFYKFLNYIGIHSQM